MEQIRRFELKNAQHSRIGFKAKAKVLSSKMRPITNQNQITPAVQKKFKITKSLKPLLTKKSEAKDKAALTQLLKD